MEDLKQKAEKAIEEICGHLNTPTGCATLSDITRYIGWLEGRLLSLNTTKPINVSSPFKTNFDWEINKNKKIFEYMPPMFINTSNKEKSFEVTCLENGGQNK